jgi:hypothetical protein
MEKMFGWRKRIKWFNWRSDEATRGEGEYHRMVLQQGLNIGERDVDIRGSNVVAMFVLIKDHIILALMNKY